MLRYSPARPDPSYCYCESVALLPVGAISRGVANFLAGTRESITLARDSSQFASVIFPPRAQESRARSPCPETSLAGSALQTDLFILFHSYPSNRAVPLPFPNEAAILLPTSVKLNGVPAGFQMMRLPAFESKKADTESQRGKL